MELLDDLLAGLTPAKTADYDRSRIPDEVDDVLLRLVGRLRRADPSEWPRAWPKLGDRIGMLCLILAERMAALTVRTGEAEHAQWGLNAACVGARLIDPRDGMARLAPLHDALARIGRDPAPYFQAAEPLADPSFLEPLRRFPGRTEANRSLAAMLYEAGRDADGFRYIQRW